MPARISSGIVESSLQQLRPRRAQVHPALTQAPAATPMPASPVVAAVRPGQPSPWPVPLPAQQVQAATVAGLHAEGPVSTQHLAWRAVAAGLAVPHAVLEAAREGSGRQKTGPRGQGGVLWGEHRATGER